MTKTTEIETMCAYPAGPPHQISRAPDTERPDLCWSHQPHSPRVPVIVEYTYQHVVWVEAPDFEDGQPMAKALEQARSAIESEAYEYTNDQETLADAGWDVRVPTDLDYDFLIYGYASHPGGGKDHDVHIQAYRAEQWRAKRDAEKAACADAGHPNLEEPISDGRRFCPGCHEYLPATEQIGAQG